MPSNPNRSSRGGDVEGEEATDPGLGLSIGKPMMVSKASYDPGYPVGDDDDHITKAELKVGYSSYGHRKVGQN